MLRLLLIRCGAEGGTRTPTSYLTRPSNVRVYQFRHFGSSGKDVKASSYFFVGCGVAVIVNDVGFATGAVLVAGDG